MPDSASRAKLQEKQSSIFSEKYEDYIRLGVEEWEKTYKELEPTGKKSILFIMTDDTKNCDDVAEFLEKSYPRLKGAVLTIHTNKSGEISETVTGKKEKELKELRKKANEIEDEINILKPKLILATGNELYKFLKSKIPEYDIKKIYHPAFWFYRHQKIKGIEYYTNICKEIKSNI